MRVGDVWQGWRTAYDPSQPRDERGRWTDAGGDRTTTQGRPRLGDGGGADYRPHYSSEEEIAASDKLYAYAERKYGNTPERVGDRSVEDVVRDALVDGAISQREAIINLRGYGVTKTAPDGRSMYTRYRGKVFGPK